MKTEEIRNTIQNEIEVYTSVDAAHIVVEKFGDRTSVLHDVVRIFEAVVLTLDVICRHVVQEVLVESSLLRRLVHERFIDLLLLFLGHIWKFCLDSEFAIFIDGLTGRPSVNRTSNRAKDFQEVPHFCTEIEWDVLLS